MLHSMAGGYDLAQSGKWPWCCAVWQMVIMLHSLACGHNAAQYGRWLWRCTVWQVVMMPCRLAGGHDAAQSGRWLWRCVVWQVVIMLDSMAGGYDGVQSGTWLWHFAVWQMVMTLWSGRQLPPTITHNIIIHKRKLCILITTINCVIWGFHSIFYKDQVVWHMTCWVVICYQCFGTASCLILQGSQRSDRNECLINTTSYSVTIRLHVLAKSDYKSSFDNNISGLRSQPLQIYIYI